MKLRLFVSEEGVKHRVAIFEELEDAISYKETNDRLLNSAHCIFESALYIGEVFTVIYAMP